MKIIGSFVSPYVRKVTACLEDRGQLPFAPKSNCPH